MEIQPSPFSSPKEIRKEFYEVGCQQINIIALQCWKFKTLNLESLASIYHFVSHYYYKTFLNNFKSLTLLFKTECGTKIKFLRYLRIYEISYYMCGLMLIWLTFFYIGLLQNY